MKSGVTVVVPTIPPRAHMLPRALTSVQVQTRQAEAVVVEADPYGTGAAATRNRALARVDTEYVAFLDDDDEWLPFHLEHVMATMEEAGADLVYPWYGGINQGLFHPDPLGRPFDDAARDYILRIGNFIPVTCVVRMEPLMAVGGFAAAEGSTPWNPCEDWGTWRRMLLNGAVFAHHPEVTWIWHGHPDGLTSHTSGRPWTMG